MSAKPLITSRSTREWQELDSRHYLHPFTDFKALAAEGSRVITRAEGVYLFDCDGEKILDGMSGLWCVNVGYGRKELAEAAYRQMQELPYYNSFFQSANPPAIELARLLAELTPPQFNKVFYAGGGSEANDTILRMVRRYWALRGQPDRNVIISRRNAYHGSTMGGASLGGMAGCTPRVACRFRASCTSSSPTGSRTASMYRPSNLACVRPAGWPRRSRNSAPSGWPPSSASRSRGPAA